MTWLRSLVREPLAHFVVAGGVLFAVYALAFAPEQSAEDDATIVVDRAALLSFLQYRANAFESGTFGGLLDSMTEAERARLVDAYVEEEILTREARALGLEASDYVIRQRMVQKMRYLFGDVVAAAEDIDPDALRDYFEANREAYAVAPAVTFTHVFLDASRRGEKGAHAAAVELRDRLVREGARFNDAPGYGDRFPFLTNYVERTFDYVASQFGQSFAAELAQLEPSPTEWRGPIASAYGQHLVLVAARANGRLPALEDVRARVEEDFRRDAAQESLSDAVAALKERYRIVVTELDADAAQ